MSVYQNQSSIDSLHKEGCYFSCLYNFKEQTTLAELESYWNQSIEKGLLDSNFIIVDPQGVVDLMQLPLKYRDQHYPATTPLEPNTYRILELFRPSNGFHHFVQGNSIAEILHGNGYDPISPFSLTIQAPETYIESIRLYDIVS